MKYFGYSIYFWIVLIIFIIFSSYIFKTIYGVFYEIITGRPIDPAFYTTGRYGTYDYSYDVGKAVFRI